MKKKSEQIKKKEANHPKKRECWAEVEQFQCLRDAVSRAADRYCRSGTPRKVNEGTRKEQVPARIMLVEAQPTGRTNQSLPSGAAQQQQHCRQR